MKRMLVLALTLVFAAGVFGSTAWAQATTGTAKPADATKPADTAKPADTTKPAATAKPTDTTKPAVKTETEKAKDKVKDKKAAKKGKGKAKKEAKAAAKDDEKVTDEKARGLDRADQAAGEHGKQGREKARAKQNR